MRDARCSTVSQSRTWCSCSCQLDARPADPARRRPPGHRALAVTTPLRPADSRDLESQARARSYLVQMLVGIETLKVASAEDRAFEHWANLYVDELNVSLTRNA